jgi:hypothetical protein
VRELATANPAWVDAASGDADVLIAADHGAARFAALAGDPRHQPRQRVVWWTGSAEAPADVEAALLAWYRAGWEPHLLETMGYRALSSFPELRSGAIVLHAVEPERAQRAAAVRSLLCAPAAATPPFEGGRCILHPMQDLQLHALAA